MASVKERMQDNLIEENKSEKVNISLENGFYQGSGQYMYFNQDDIEGVIYRINCGLPFRYFEDLVQRLQISRATLATYLRFSLNTLVRGRANDMLTPAESEHLARLLRIYDLCFARLGSEKLAREWLTTAHPELRGLSPLEYARYEFGARLVEDIICKESKPETRKS